MGIFQQLEYSRIKLWVSMKHEEMKNQQIVLEDANWMCEFNILTQKVIDKEDPGIHIGYWDRLNSG